MGNGVSVLRLFGPGGELALGEAVVQHNGAGHSHVVPKVCGKPGGSDLGQLALRRLPFSARSCLRPPQASACLGQSASWAALAGHTGLGFLT